MQAGPGASRPSGTGDEHVHLSAELGGELLRLGTHPVREVKRLEHEAATGESAATPAILIAGVAIVLVLLVALAVTAAFAVPHLHV